MTRRPLRLTAALALVAALAGPARATDLPTQPVRDLLGLLPMPALDNAPVLYLDLAALRATGTADWRTERSIVTLPDRLRMPVQLDVRQPGGFAAKAGFGPDQIDRIAVYETSPGPGPTALRLRDTDPDALAKAWVQNGFAESDTPGGRIWTRGTPGQMQLDRADPADPLATNVGASAVLALDDATLLIARLPETMALMRSSAKLGAGAGTRADLRRLLEALDRTLAPQEAVTQLLWAPLPDAAGDAGVETAMAAMHGATPATPEALKQAMDGATGILSYPSLLLGEVRAAGQAPAGLMAVLFADCAIADGAGRIAAAKWDAAAKDPDNRSAGPLGRMTAAWRSVPVDGGCVLLGRAAGHDPGRSAFVDIYALFMTRSLSPLYVGPPPKP